MHLLREISLDKVREWKQFYRIKQQRGLGFHLPIENQPENKKSSYGKSSSSGTEMVKLGYEVYTDGLTRVLRICQFADRRKGDTSFHSKTKMQLIISSLAIQLLECAKQVSLCLCVAFPTAKNTTSNFKSQFLFFGNCFIFFICLK